MTLVKKAIQGIGWVSLFVATTKGVRFLTTIILARLLEPKDFGLVAIGILALNTLAIFRDLGVGSALIYQKDNLEKAANTTFTLLPFVGLAMFIIAVLAAPYIADFFSSPESESIIRVLSISLLITSMGITPSILLDKELEFRKQFLPEVGSILSYGFIAIPLALSGYGVWSIVYGKVLATFVWLVIIWKVSPWRPKIEFDFEIAKGLLGYGRLILGATFISFLLSNLDNGFVGKFLGTTALGFYSIAYTVSNLPALNITNLIQRVMFPMFSKMQKNNITLARIYLKTIKYSSTVTVPVTMGVFVLAPDLITSILGVKWMPALLPLQVLCIAGVLRSVRSSTGILFNAMGRPDISQRLLFYELVTVCILIYPLSMIYGLVGTSLAVTLTVLIFALIAVMKSSDLLNIGLKRFSVVVSPPYIASFLMIVVVYMSRLIVPDLGVIRLILLGAIGSVSYVSFIYVINREIVKEVKELLSSLKD